MRFVNYFFGKENQMKNSQFADFLLTHRRMVVTGLFIAFCLLLAIRFWGFPTLDENGNTDWHSLVVAVLEGLISTIVISFVVAVTLWWTKPPLDRIPPGFEVPPVDISKTLEAAASESDVWEYNGHTGRYVRNQIFQRLRQRSRQHNMNVSVRMMILDPRNIVLCNKYARYRTQRRSNVTFGDDWTPQTVQQQLIATVAKTACLHAENNQVQCEIRFRTVLSQFRFDKSNYQILVTQEDPQEPAFSYPKGSRFFDYYERENHLIWDQSPNFDIAVVAPIDAENREDLQSKLNEFMGGDEEAEQLVASALEIVDNDHSPYA